MPLYKPVSLCKLNENPGKTPRALCKRPAHHANAPALCQRPRTLPTPRALCKHPAHHANATCTMQTPRAPCKRPRTLPTPRHSANATRTLPTQNHSANSSRQKYQALAGAGTPFANKTCALKFKILHS